MFGCLAITFWCPERESSVHLHERSGVICYFWVLRHNGPSVTFDPTWICYARAFRHHGPVSLSRTFVSVNVSDTLPLTIRCLLSCAVSSEFFAGSYLNSRAYFSHRIFRRLHLLLGHLWSTPSAQCAFADLFPRRCARPESHYRRFPLFRS